MNTFFSKNLQGYEIVDYCQDTPCYGEYHYDVLCWDDLKNLKYFSFPNYIIDWSEKRFFETSDCIWYEQEDRKSVV